MKLKLLAMALPFVLNGCATLDESGEKVTIVASVGPECKNLGPVNVTITGWGLASESQNVLRNNTAEKGGNTLIQNGDSSGIAYLCPADTTAR